MPIKNNMWITLPIKAKKQILNKNAKSNATPQRIYYVSSKHMPTTKIGERNRSKFVPFSGMK